VNEVGPASDLPTARKLTPKGAATRARILELATEAFANQGYAATSIRTVAVSAGMTTGAIYAIFGSKAGLLLEVVRESIETDLEDFPPEVLERPLPDIVTWQFERSDTPRRRRLRKLLVEAAGTASTDVEVRDALGALLRSRLATWAEAHREWQASEAIDPTIDMDALTAMSMALELGIGLLDELAIRTPTPTQSADFVARMLRSLVPTDRPHGPQRRQP
jgi:AcrR family transcriptional regulator